METEQRIAAAKEVLHRFLGRYTHRHSRIHDETALENVNRLRALDGLCGECTSLKLQFDHNQGKDLVGVGCNKGYSPVVLYDNTLPGEQASCDGYAKRAEKK